MHIKQVVIEGFKSYKNKTETEAFSDRINTVVGANGSGKSNFFQAIRFVLDVSSSATRPDERQKLLHEGAGHSVLSAYVEVVFDNTDQRLPVDRDEVRLRRTISNKKDEYTLDRKKTAKTEVINFLESAGFSRANPYYVVQQGKIMSMSTMKDEERLDLLKEIGGSKVYEDRRKESLKILHDTEGRKSQIEELVADMEAKLRQLDAEKQELAKYQEIDKERRSLEYAIYDKEVSETSTKLEQIEEQRQQETERAGRVLGEREVAHASLKQAEKELKSVTAQQTSAKQAFDNLQEQKREAVGRHARLELDVKEIEEKCSLDSATQAECQKQLKYLEKDITGVERRLKAAQTDVAAKRQAVDSITLQVEDAQRRLQALEMKQGQAHNFASTSERDAWIRNEIKAKDSTLKQQQRQIKDFQAQIATLQSERVELAQDLDAKEEEVQQLQQQTSQASRAKQQQHNRKNEAQNKRQDVRRREDELLRSKKTLMDEAAHLQRKVDPSGYQHQEALKSARKFCRDYNIPVHGTVLDLIRGIPQLDSAIEVAAGGSLFHLVLDNDEQVSKLLGLLKKEGKGRVTCLPLNRLNVDAVEYPKQFGQDAVPLINHLKYAPEHKIAIQHVFSKWMVCKDPETASKVIAATSQLSCVTITGTMYSKKGTITGGHREEGRNKMEAYREKVNVDEKLTRLGEELHQLREDAEKWEQEVNNSINEEQQLALQDGFNKKAIQRLQTEVRTAKGRLGDIDHSIVGKQHAITAKELAIQQLREEVTAIRTDLGSKELGELTPQEQQEKQQLQPEIQRLKDEQSRLQIELDEAQARLDELEARLTDNLRRRQRELQEQLSTVNVDADTEALDSRRQEAAQAQAMILELTGKEQEALTKVEELGQRSQDLRAQAERFRELQDSDNRQAGDEASLLEQLIAKRNMLQQKKADLEKKIRELGSLPAEAFEKFRATDLKALQRLLTKAQNALKKYGHVNKKALDQYLNFTEQRAELVRRLDEAVHGRDKIRHLIHTLDQRKDEALQRTFRGVAKNFREIFAVLAPGGKGELVMVKAQSKEAARDDGDNEENPNGLAAYPDTAHDSYSGVKVKVSFGAGETMSLKQLSGGQKTLVALALIFSIQRLDPAPFYLFDEIDAALDPAYRTTVASMLAHQASNPNDPSQFIITTFHPQIVHETDKVFGVSHSARISDITVIDKDAALKFLTVEELRAQAQEDEDDDA